MRFLYLEYKEFLVLICKPNLNLVWNRSQDRQDVKINLVK
ncbi:hypothetical protein LEP1GSC050_0053 [Leptospira phage vB_LbrZ_5399-LE1]|nr:hypothetical protein LEP1GSC050_0053 [Leptospira phage vB_LbrZ_5399-LE1]AGS80858.1 hypothetical protein LEP1GSC047_0916 [Leptospira phage vB_LinZ_10-LE1]